MHKKAKTCLRAAISAGLLLVLLLFFVDLGQAWRVLAGCRWQFILLLLAWSTADRFLMAYKWRLLVLARGLPLGWAEALKSYYLAGFAGCFLPTTLGADALRVTLVAGPQRPSEMIAASVLLERALGFVAAALAAVIGLVLLTGLTSRLPREFFVWSLAILLGGAGAVIVSFSALAGRLHQRLEQRLLAGGRLLAWLSRFIKAYHDYRRHRGVLAWFLLLSFLEQAAPIVGNWLAALALNIPLSLIQAAAVTPVVFLLARLPVSFSSFGVLEGLYMALFSLVGLDSTQAFLLGLVTNLTALVSALPAVPWYLSGGLRAGSDGAKNTHRSA